MRTLCISDIHGCYKQFEELLLKINYNPDSDQLILLGDYVDRGINSKKVVERVMQLVKDYGVIALKGNHDDMMVKAFRNQGDELWLYNGGINTVISYIGQEAFENGFTYENYYKAKELMMKHCSEHITFLENLPYYYEDDTHIYVHAGINPNYMDEWKHQPIDDFIWIREQFFRYPTTVNKKVIFGHTPCEHLHGTSDIWFKEDKIGIDGACAYGRQLNCLEIIGGGYNTYFVK